MPYTPASDIYAQRKSDVFFAPPRQFVAITPSDSADLATYVRGLTCGTAGAVSVVPMGSPDETAVVVNLVAGQWLPMFVRKVNATGTTAAGIVGALL